MANVVSNLVVRIDSDVTGFIAGMGKVEGKFASTQAKMASIGSALTKSVSLPLIAMGGIAVAGAMDVGKGMRIIKQQTGDTGAVLANMGNQFRETLSRVPQNAGQVATVLADIHKRTGLVGPPLQNLTEKILTLGRVTGGDVTELVRTSTRAFADWGIATKDQGKSLDFLYGVTTKTGVPINSLLDNLSKFGSPMRGLGISFETTAAMIGKFEQAGVRVDLAMGGLRMGLARLAKAGKDPQKEFPILLQQIKDAGSAAEANKIAIELFGARAGPDLAAAIKEGKFEVADLIKQLNQSPVSIDKVGKETLTLSDRFKILKNQVFLSLEPLGKALIDAFKAIWPIISGTIRFIGNIIKAFSRLPSSVQKVIVVVGVLVAALGPMISIGVKVMKAFKMIHNAFRILVIGFAASPWMLVIAGIIAAVVVAAILIKKYWKQIAPVLQAVWNAIKKAFDAVWPPIKRFLMAIWNPIKAFFERNWITIKAVLITVWTIIKTAARVIWEALKIYFKVWLKVVQTAFKVVWWLIKNIIVPIWKVIFTIAKVIWNALKIFFTIWLAVVSTAFKIAWTVIKTVLTVIWNIIKVVATVVWDIIKTVIWTPIKWVWDALVMAWNVIKAVLTVAWNVIKSIAQTVWEVIKTVIWNPVKWVWDKLVDAWNTIRDFIVGVWDGIKEKASSIWNGIKDVVSKVWDGIQGVWDGIWGTLKGIVKSGVLGVLKAVRALVHALDWAIPGGATGKVDEWIGKVESWHTGGGPTSGGLALLKRNEYVMQPSAVSTFGLGFMDDINAGRMPALAGAGGLNVTIHFHSVDPDYDGKHAVAAMESEVKKSQHLKRLFKNRRR